MNHSVHKIKRFNFFFTLQKKNKLINADYDLATR